MTSTNGEMLNTHTHKIRCWYSEIETVLFENPKLMFKLMDKILSYDIASGSEITPCIKIDKPDFGNIMK